MTRHNFHLFVFTTDGAIARSVVAGGASGIVIDWENKEKTARQAGKDTQINYDTVDDLMRMRATTASRLICRINRNADIRRCRGEIDEAIAAGADEILLPMGRTLREVLEVLDHAGGRCGTGILIETNEAVELARELGKLPLSRVYMGLNDLAIDRKKTNIFEALEDGTVDRVRQSIEAPFGFAGLTLPESGYPIPCRFLISEMARLECSFAFLRRSFLSDVRGKDAAAEVSRIYKAVYAAFESPDEEKTANREEIKRIIRDCSLQSMKFI